MRFCISIAGQVLFVKKKKKKEAAQRNVHTRLSFNHLKSDNIKVSNMLF